MLGRRVIKSRLNHILEHIVGIHCKHLRAVLDSTSLVLIGSSALDIMLYSTSPVLQYELRIATPRNAKHVLAAFFDSLGFTVNTVSMVYIPTGATDMFHLDYLEKDGR